MQIRNQFWVSAVGISSQLNLNQIIWQRRAFERQLYTYLFDNRLIVKIAWVNNCMTSVRIPLCNNEGLAYCITSYTQSIYFGSRGTTTTSHCTVYFIAIDKHNICYLLFFPHINLSLCKPNRIFQLKQPDLNHTWCMLVVVVVIHWP